MKKRGQFWYLDFIIGLIIISLVGVFFVTVAKEISIKQQTTNNLINTGVSLSSTLMSEGSEMSSWKQGKGRIGLLKEDKVELDETKLAAFKSLMEVPDGYKTSKYLLGVKEDYVFYFEYIDPKPNPEEKINIITYPETGFYGKGITELAEIEGEKISVVRYLFWDTPSYNANDGTLSFTPDGKGQIIKMVVVVWRE